MRCAGVERLLPLYVGRDLDARGARRIAAHLAECRICRGTEAGLRESRAWIESAPPPPMDESDFAAVRQGVWRRIEAEGSAAKSDRRRAGRLALAGGLLAGALSVVFLSLRPGREAVAPAARNIAVSPEAVWPAETPIVMENAPSAAPRRRGHSLSPALRPAIAAARPGVARIEFQTANPNVRIIWLVNTEEGTSSGAAGRNQEAS